MPSAEVEIARLQVQMEGLNTKVRSMEEKLDSTMGKLDDLKGLMTEARGGLRTVLLIGGCVASITTVIAWIVSHVTYH